MVKTVAANPYRGSVPLSRTAPFQFRQGAADIFACAESARDGGNLEDAARLFGRAAESWRTTGNVLEAADAYLELGALLLRQGRGKILPDLAVRTLNLLKIVPLPPGARLNLWVFAALMKKATVDRDPFLALVLERRLGRLRRARAS